MALDSKFRDFEKARIELNIQRIRNIFYLLKINRVKIIVYYCDSAYSAKIIDIKNDFINLFISDLHFTQKRKVDLYFEVSNKYYSFLSNIEKFEREILSIYLPNKMKYFQNRKYPRVQLDDLFIRFNIADSIYDIATEQGIDIIDRYKYFFDEITKDTPSLKLLYEMLIAEVKKVGSDFSVKMLYHKNFNEYTIFEKIMLEERKSILIEDTSKLDAYIKQIQNPFLTNLYNYYSKRKEEVEGFTAFLEIENIRKNDSKESLVSYVISPIYIYDQCIGYLRINTTQFQKYRILLVLANNISRVCSLFSYGLTRIKVYKDYWKPYSTGVRVLNISMTGLLMEISDAVIFEYLKKQKMIKMLIPYMQDEIETYGEIVRFFSKNGIFYIGVSFMKYIQSDILKLEEYIYENLRYNFF